MRYNYQNDLRWRNMIMTNVPYPNGNKQPYPDYIGLATDLPKTSQSKYAVGCYLTSWANIIQEIIGRTYTPDMLNQYIIENDGYFILKQGKKCKKGQESFLIDKVIQDKWKVEVVNNLEPTEYRSHWDEIYMCRWIHYYRGHFSNILGDCIIKDKPYFRVFNVWNGEIELIPFHNITYIKRIIK